MAGTEPPGAAERCRFDQSASGACGAQDCQAEITRAACDHGQDKKNRTICPAGRVVKVNEVTTPKLPPPPPRQAQNRSGLVLALHVLSWPSAVTICRDFTLSLVRPYARDTTPTPPPRVSPAMPTVGQDPPGTARPCAESPL